MSSASSLQRFRNPADRKNYANPKIARACVKRLRGKLGDDSSRPAYILTERRVGYRMARRDQV